VGRRKKSPPVRGQQGREERRRREALPSPPKRPRADQRLVELGLAESRSKAQACILAGQVFLGDARIEKAGQAVDPEAQLTLKGPPHPYVSRGGVKLEGALDDLGVDVTGLVVADFGASTGGFTDCVLQRGAARVYAIDVGYGQLHHRLRTDDRVVVMERTNARHLEALPEPVDLVVIDASFIGIGKLLPAAVAVLGEAGRVLGMVKPQFEVGREGLDKGVVRDGELRRQAIDRASEEAAALHLSEEGRVDSRLAGPEGNVEAFVSWALKRDRRG
jgi:23S rRNA (cytidine1920-2'-O)/16S rRNA (cytidine1409-2'-O)-methyltransferase